MWSRLLHVVLITGAVFSDETATSLEKQELNPVKMDTKFHKFDISDWFRPITESVSNFVALTKHPNFGGFQLLNPTQIWEKLHEKGAGLLTGPYAAAIGASHNSQTDYPFAYRKTKN